MGSSMRALRHSHDRLAGLVAALSADDLTARSYDDDWSVAQVLSHLGSGAEIFTGLVTAGRHGEPVPGQEQFKAIWDRWNAKSPQDQARDSLAANAAFLELLDSFADDERERWQLDLFGSPQRLPDIVRMRLSEHAVHTWDVAVAFDAAATIAPDAVELIIDALAPLVQRVGKPAERPLRVRVTTRGPNRVFDLEIGPDGARLSASGHAPNDHAPNDHAPNDHAPNEGDAALDLSAEAFIRLVYGRLDDAHTPPLKSVGVGIDTLRASFPGL